MYSLKLFGFEQHVTRFYFNPLSYEPKYDNVDLLLKVHKQIFTFYHSLY